MTLLAVTTTVATMEDARRLAHAAVQSRLAACVQMEAIESVYLWEGKLAQEPEVRLLFKTTAACYDALQRLLLDTHPYTLPALYAVEVARAAPGYEEWVRGNTESGVV